MKKNNIKCLRWLFLVALVVLAGAAGGVWCVQHRACAPQHTAVYAQVNERDEYGRTPLHRAARAGRLQDVEGMVQAGAEIDAEDDEQRTPLYFAVAANHIPVVTALLQMGADVRKETESATMPLRVAVENGNLDIVKLLLQAGANINARYGYDVGDVPALIAAVQGKGNADFLRELLQLGPDIQALDTLSGRTALHWAVIESSPEKAKVLLEAGVNINSRDGLGQTPLHEAAAENNVKMIEFLLAHGADINARDIKQYTPLQEAVSGMQHEAAELLRNAGADESVIPLSDDSKPYTIIGLPPMENHEPSPKTVPRSAE